MRTRKRFGQHFLEPAWVRKLVKVVAPHADEEFVEIGPGLGALTIPLAHLVRRVVAIEIDRDLAGRLSRIVPANVEVRTDDFLKADLRALVDDAAPVRVVGNVPYNISSPIVLRLVALADQGRFVADATLMLQREVADRIVARPGGAEYGVLGITAQFHARVARSLLLPPGAFRPAPRVNSAVVRMAFGPATVPVLDAKLLEQMVRNLFMHRRKTVANALGPFAEMRGAQAGEILAKAGIDASRRPQTLDLTELARLADVFASASRPDVL